MKTFTENLNKKIKELGDEYNKKVSELIAVISKNEEKKISKIKQHFKVRDLKIIIC